MKQLLVAILALSTTWSMASESLRLVVPFAPGGPGDRVARMVQKDVRSAGKTLIVENKPGGNGDIGLKHMLQMSQSESVFMIVGTPLGFAAKPQLDSLNIEAVADIGRTPLIVTAPRGGRFASWQQLTTVSANEPVTYGNAGKASLSYLSGEIIKFYSQKNLVSVPYTGGSRMLVDLLGGRLDIGISNLGDVAQHIESQQLIPLAVTSDRRLPEYPTVPTLLELGIKDGVVYSHMVLLGVSSNSRSDVSFLQSAMTAALNDPATVQPYVKEGLIIANGSKALSQAWWQQEVRRLRDVISRTKISITE